MQALSTPEPEEKSISQILKEASDQALKGGISGAGAMVIQVCALMWMRTTMNYQYRYGTTTTQALKTLYSQGGILRFYSGVGPALIQGPLSRFGDTAANAGALTLLQKVELPSAVKTILASGFAAGFRILLMPVDALKTTLQVEGPKGIQTLGKKIKLGGPTVLWHGSLGAMSATFVGHYPWFATYNFLNENIPVYQTKVKKLLRSAFLGFCSSITSDCISNSLRVVKTYRQTSDVPVSYKQAINNIVEKDGYLGLFGRGLKTRLITNGMQGILFSVIWKIFQDILNAKPKAD